MSIVKTDSPMSDKSIQFATFYLEDRLYGINVMEVQEVTQSLHPTTIRLAPSYVKGLINLRGQIVTAIGLRELFGINFDSSQMSQASVICRIDGSLVSLLVDRIGDVIEVSSSEYEETPPTIEDGLSKYMGGVYKTEGNILSVLNIDSIARELNTKA